jgi:hypothetical protein
MTNPGTLAQLARTLDPEFYPLLAYTAGEVAHLRQVILPRLELRRKAYRTSPHYLARRLNFHYRACWDALREVMADRKSTQSGGE